jgi:hypothetical protein
VNFCFSDRFWVLKQQRLHKIMRTLVIPPAAQRDDNAIQMISAWIAEKGMHCTLNVGMWEAEGHNEPRAWGILLADVIRHVANAIEEKSGVSAFETAQSIVESLETEFGDPTSPATGGFHPGHS